VGDVLDTLVAELAGHAEAERAAELDGEIAVVHSHGEEGLRMQGVGHVDAFPPVRLDGEVDDITRLRQDAHSVEHVDQGRSDPLGDIGPTLLANHLGDLVVDGESFEVGEREGGGMGDHAVDGEAPVGKAAGLEALEGVAGRSGGVGEGRLGDHGAGEFAGQRVPGKKPLGSVGEGFAGAIEAAAIGRDESMAPGDAGSGGEARNACYRGKAGGDEASA